MARFRRLETCIKMQEIGMIPLFYHHDLETAKGALAACAHAGANVVEFTNRGDFAYEVFTGLLKYAEKNFPEMILGIGSVVEPYTAAMYINNGANFIVAPAVNAEVARLCNRRKIPYIPGTATVTEIETAEELGCEIVKIFPGAEIGGPDFVKAVKGPLPWASLMPSGGVAPTRESLSAWFKAGVTCVGMGSQLISKDILEKKEFGKLEADIRAALALTNEIRGKK